jgi:hypothetical protein
MNQHDDIDDDELDQQHEHTQQLETQPILPFHNESLLLLQENDTMQELTLTPSPLPTPTKQQPQHPKVSSKSSSCIKPIPHISKATNDIYTINDLHIESTKHFTLPLSSIQYIAKRTKISHVHGDPTVQGQIQQLYHHSRAGLESSSMSLSSSTAAAAAAATITSSRSSLQTSSLILKNTIQTLLPCRYEQYGPLHQNYKFVLSIDILGLDEDYVKHVFGRHSDNDNDNNSSTLLEDAKQLKQKKQIRLSATAAFQPVPSSSATTAAVAVTAEPKSSKKEIKKRRIRVFFYNEYATQMNQYLEKKLGPTTTNSKKGTKSIYPKGYNDNKSEEEKDIHTMIKSPYPILLSLQNIPAQCIFPYILRRNNNANESLLDITHGKLSPFCICIGGPGSLGIGSSSNHDNNDKLSGGGVETRRQMDFDSADSKIRLMSLNDTSPSSTLYEQRNELIITQSNQRFDDIQYSNDEHCVMSRKLEELMKMYKDIQGEKKRNEVIEIDGDDDDEDKVIQGGNNVVPSTASGSGKKRKRVSILKHMYNTLVSFV